MIKLKTRYSRGACSITGILLMFMIFLNARQWNVSTMDKTSARIGTRVLVTLVNPLPATMPGSSDPSGDEWPMFQGALNHTGTTITTPEQRSRPIWASNVSDTLWGEPVITGGRVYVGSYGGKLYCLNATTGSTLWYRTITTIYNLVFAPAVSDGRVCVDCYSGLTACFNATTGTPIWNYTAGYWASPSIYNGRVYFQSNKLYCLNATNGKQLWNYSCIGGSCSPAIANDCVYIGATDDKVYCVNATTGGLLWSFITGGHVDSSPVVAQGHIYVGSDDHKVYCLDAMTGAQVWNYTTSDMVESTPAIAGGYLFVGSVDGIIYCLDAMTGIQAWEFNTNWSIGLACPTVSCDRVYMTSSVGDLLCLNSTTGVQLWQYFANGESSSAIVGGRIYTGGYGFFVDCLPMILIPTSPRNFTLASGKGQIVLNWQVPLHAWGSLITNYKVYRGTMPGNEQFLATVGNVTSWTDKGLTNNQAYYYTISTVTAAGEGDRSGEASITAGLAMMPKNLQASSGDKQVVLSWNAPASDGGSSITNYKVYRGTTTGNETIMATIGNVATWTDTGLTNGQTYYYMVSAVNAAGEGPLSAEANATPMASLPPPDYTLAIGISIGIAGVAIVAIVVVIVIRLKKRARSAPRVPASSEKIDSWLDMDESR